MSYPSIEERAATARAQTLPTHNAQPMNGAQWIVCELERRNITWVAGIPGGAILPLYDALAQSSIRHVLARHEQGACFIAHGAARASGQTAVCLATSGPGATNLVTALADAKADSVPLVAITAQVPRALIGTDAFQEVDICSIAGPITKACFQASSAAELRRLLPLAFTLAQQGRPGPVLLDVPKDVLSAPILEADEVSQPAPVSRTRDVKSTLLVSADDPSTWRQIATWLAQSERPLLYVGGGIRVAAAEGALMALARKADVPVVSSLHGLGAIPSDDPLHVGMLGMHGAPYTNIATDEADLVIALGVRFDDRATGDPTKFCRNARIVHIDVDAREIGKIKPVQLGIVSDARGALQNLLPHVEPAQRPAWHARLNVLRSEHAQRPSCDAEHVLCATARVLDDTTLVTTDVGQHQMWAAQWLNFARPRSLLTSGGLGTMGFGLPAAIGAAMSADGQRVLCVSGDGSLLMNVQELVTLAELKLDVTVLLLNNAQLGLVRQQQELFYGRRYSAAHFPNNVDFAKVANAFGVRGETHSPEAYCANAAALLGRSGPQLLQIPISGVDNVLPMVPPGRSNLEMIVR
jgi:acetolactate synthase I/II/III large subunit